MTLETYIVNLIRDKQKGFFHSFLRFILLMMSYCYRVVVRIRNSCFDSGLFSKYYPPVPLVISIGNIVAGGTGKTPATIFIAEEFIEEFKIAILSRGYRSPAEKQSFPTILSEGKGPLYGAAYCGDEPYMIAENLKKAFVIVGKNRHQSSNIAAKFGCQLLLLDDGMQHRQLARDLEVVVMDAEDPFGQGYFLPRGYLRDDLSSLSRAHLIILNHVQNSEHFLEVKTKILEFTKASVIGCQLKITNVYDLKYNEVPSLNNKKVGLFCAIAKPEKFKQTVLGQGAIVLAEFFIADHLEFDLAKLEQFSIDCKQQGIEMLVCTEKDRVKFLGYLDFSVPVVWLKAKLHLTEGISEWNNFVQKAKNDIIRQM